MGGRNVGTFLQRARSGRGCSTRASAGDRAVAAQGGLASLRPRYSPPRASRGALGLCAPSLRRSGQGRTVADS